VRKKQQVGWIKHARIWGVYTNIETYGQTRSLLARLAPNHHSLRVQDLLMA
jgi:hypothetical protein